MPRTLPEIRRDFDQWLATYTTKHCPGIPMETLLDAIVAESAVLQATIALDRLIDTNHPDLPAVEAAARTLCLAWVAAITTLKTARFSKDVPRETS